jgi:carbonic anhydrase
MQKLADGIHEFQNDYFAQHRDLYERLVTDGQRPHTLFITCSDSRLDPNRFTNAKPGELFIVRNIGNVVPSVALPGGTAAAIEYAVCFLEVEQIVICGHTHCGAIQAVLEPERMDKLPFVKRWLAETTRVRGIVEQRYGHLEGPERVTAAVEENVLVQIENVRAFPFVAERLKADKLHLSAWVYKIETGEVFGYDPEAGQYARLTSGKSTPPPPSIGAR